jgi:hypothetical protein
MARSTFPFRIPRYALRLPFLAALPALQALGPAWPQPAPAAACDPSFPAIHDFQVGDVFQYRIQGGAQFAAGEAKWDELRKYRISAKEGTPQARTYRIAGLSRRYAAYPNGLKDTTYGIIEDSLRLVDSVEHPLNGCAGDTVPVPDPGYGFTRIEVARGDTGWFALAEPSLLMKRLGGQEVPMPGQPVFDGPRPTRIYAEGLGMVGESVAYLSTSARVQSLTGYVRAGRTVGAIVPDAQLQAGTPIRVRPVSDQTRGDRIAGGRRTASFDAWGRRLAVPRIRARVEARPIRGAR